MPNHFHLLLRFKTEEEVEKARANPNLGGLEDLRGFAHPNLQDLRGLTSLNLQDPRGLQLKKPSQYLSNFLNAYAKAYNKRYNRKGSLFMRSAGRVKVDSDSYFKQLIKYIHLNPVKPGLVLKSGEWKFSSYNEVITQTDTFIEKEYLLELFDDIEDFIAFHKIESV